MRQHANTNHVIPKRPPDGVVFPQSTDAVRDVSNWTRERITVREVIPFGSPVMRLEWRHVNAPSRRGVHRIDFRHEHVALRESSDRMAVCAGIRAHQSGRLLSIACSLKFAQHRARRLWIWGNTTPSAARGNPRGGVACCSHEAGSAQPLPNLAASAARTAAQPWRYDQRADRGGFFY